MVGKSLPALVFTLTLALGSTSALAQPSPVPGAAEVGSESAFTLKRAALLKQCPETPGRADTVAAMLPIHLLVFGSTGPAVLMIHGGVQGNLGGGPDTFDRQHLLAKQGWRLLLPERPGFGESPSRGPDDQVKDSVWIAGMLGDNAHLIGHSWGGTEALLAAASRPIAIRSLTLVEPALDQLLHDDPTYKDDPRLRQGAVSLPALILGSATPGDFAQKFAGSLGRAEAPAAPPELTARMGCGLLQARPAEPTVLRQAAAVVKAAHVPVLVMTGGWSPSLDVLGDLVAELTGGRHVIVPSPDHFIMLSNPTGFNDAVSAFMRQADAMSIH